MATVYATSSPRTPPYFTSRALGATIVSQSTIPTATLLPALHLRTTTRQMTTSQNNAPRIPQGPPQAPASAMPWIQARSRAHDLSVTVPSSLPSQAEHYALRKQGFKYQPCPATPSGRDFGRASRRREPVPKASTLFG